MTSTYEIVPLEQIVVPAELDGVGGQYRLSADDARTDLQAVLDWIDAAHADVTQRARRGLAEKVLNWAYGVRGKALSSCGWEDFNAFFRFLARPEPREAWCSGVRVPRDAPEWRPLVSPATPHYKFQLARHLRSLVIYLAEAKHANLNFTHCARLAKEVPMAAETGQLKHGNVTKVEALPASLWRQIETILAHGSSTERLIVHLIYFCGLSATEVSRLSGGDFVREHGARLPAAFRVARGSGEVVLRMPKELQRLVADEARARGGWARFAQVTNVFRLKPTTVLAAAAGVLRRAAREAEIKGDVGAAQTLLTYTPTSLRHAGKAYQARSAPLAECSFVEEALVQESEKGLTAVSEPNTPAARSSIHKACAAMWRDLGL